MSLGVMKPDFLVERFALLQHLIDMSEHEQVLIDDPLPAHPRVHFTNVKLAWQVAHLGFDVCERL